MLRRLRTTMLFLVLLSLLLAACNLTAVPPTLTEEPTNVVFNATNTPQPTSTPQPTFTTPPTATTIPRATDKPVYRVSQGGFVPICGVVPNVAAANIRSGPGTNFPVLGVLPANNWLFPSRVNNNGWYQIVLPGTPVDGGWISGTVVVLQQPCVCGPNNCVQVNTPQPTFTPIQPTPTYTPPPNACILSVLSPNDNVNMYYQPSTASSIFGALAYGVQVEVAGRSSDGWYAFDIAAMQAPNVGIYRLRWVQSDAHITLNGAKCGTLKVIDLTAPQPYKDCTVTPINISSINVYAQHTYDAGIWGTLNAGSSLPVVGKTPPNWYSSANGWYAVQVNPGINPGMEMGRYGLRWLPIDANGQTAGDCTELPTVTLDP
ncbi:MAG: SH3 domain-containing protein [Anaerolineae bacterium]